MNLRAQPTITSTELQPPPQPPFITQNTKLTMHPGSSYATRQSLSFNPTVVWTSSIARHTRKGRLTEAVREYVRMMQAGVEPNYVTLVTLFSGCADFPSESELLGASLHGYTRKLGWVTEDVKVGTAVVNMYAKCGRVELARRVFNEMGVRNNVTWNTMMNGYVRKGEICDAVDMFNEMPLRDAISWTVLINGFVRTGHFENALQLFRQMQLSGVSPDYVTIISVIAACADLGTIGVGLWMHRYIMKQNFRDNMRVCNALMDMYSRCGCVKYAHQIFKKMRKRTLVSWNTIIVGFALNGHAELALEFFNRMQKEGLEPDGVSFTGVLTACSHAGLVDEGLRYFHIMLSVHGIVPRIEHYGCLVDLYSRAGRLEDALNVIESMPMKPNEVVLQSLLAACRTQEHMNLAERLAKYAVGSNPDSDSNYVLLANIYAAAGSWESANKLRRKMKSRGVQKKPGFSSIEVDCCNHEFVAGDKSHQEEERIYEVLDLLSSEMKAHAYVHQTIANELYEND